MPQYNIYIVAECRLRRSTGVHTRPSTPLSLLKHNRKQAMSTSTANKRSTTRRAVTLDDKKYKDLSDSEV